jgi:hypothetical protein
VTAAIDEIRTTLNEPCILELVDETDHITTVESERLCQVELRKRRGIFEHG